MQSSRRMNWTKYHEIYSLYYAGQCWQSVKAGWSSFPPPCVKGWMAGAELLAIAPYCDFPPTHFYLHILELFLDGSLSQGCSGAKISTKHAEKYCRSFSDEIWNFRREGWQWRGRARGGVHGFQRWSDFIFNFFSCYHGLSALLKSMLFNLLKSLLKTLVWIRYLSTMFLLVIFKWFHKSTKCFNHTNIKHQDTLVGKITQLFVMDEQP